MAQLVKNSPVMWDTWVRSWVGKIPWRRECLPTPVFWPGEFHGQRSLAGYSPWSHKELDMTERLLLSLSVHCVTHWRKQFRLKRLNFVFWASTARGPRMETPEWPHFSEAKFFLNGPTYLSKAHVQGTSLWSSDRDSAPPVLSLQAVQIWSLVGELRSHIPYSATKGSKNKKYLLM